ncbi:MAG: SMC-Scp complex subunit ScpB [Planctomycetota bacterium]|nr:SMC-Scp complex subunit ScpB [Planctomycetota bacterium]
MNVSEPDSTHEVSADEAAEREVAATVEAVLFASDAPLSAAKIAQVAKLPGQRAVNQAIESLNARYKQAGCAFHIDRLAGGWQMLTHPQYHDVLASLLQTKSQTRLSQAALETLAIVAYRQPVLRADIEVIRGVACGEVLRGLMEKNLIKIIGRAEVLGRPMLYGTTRRFLEVFGLGSLDDLPQAEELRKAVAASGKAPTNSKAAASDQAEPAPQDEDDDDDKPEDEDE